jgi:hypothetical protein
MGGPKSVTTKTTHQSFCEVVKPAILCDFPTEMPEEPSLDAPVRGDGLLIQHRFQQPQPERRTL